MQEETKMDYMTWHVQAVLEYLESILKIKSTSTRSTTVNKDKAIYAFLRLFIFPSAYEGGTALVCMKTFQSCEAKSGYKLFIYKPKSYHITPLISFVHDIIQYGKKTDSVKS